MANVRIPKVCDKHKCLTSACVGVNHGIMDCDQNTCTLQVARKKADLKKKLRVQFHNEPGLDMGGLTKEWFLLLLRKIFQEEYGMFLISTLW